jgi:hypothetical protein
MNPIEKIIEELKKLYVADQFKFDFNVSMFLAGNHKKKLRQDVMAFLTGVKPPANKCGIHAVSERIKASIEQYTLF